MKKTFSLVLFCIIALSISVVSYAGIREDLQKYYRVEKPEGPGPFPAVMLVPGGSGFKPQLSKAHSDRVQRRLVDMGFVTIHVDYLAARNVDNCTELKLKDVAGDICIATDYLRQKPFVKKEAINVLGWGFGGACALWALRSTGDRKPAQVAAVIAYYPSCMVCEEWDSEVPVLALFGAKDNITRFPICRSIFSRLPKPDKLTVRVYDDAHNTFDNEDIPEPTNLYDLGIMCYNEAAAKAAWKEVTNFLRK